MLDYEDKFSAMDQRLASMQEYFSGLIIKYGNWRAKQEEFYHIHHVEKYNWAAEEVKKAKEELDNVITKLIISAYKN